MGVPDGRPRRIPKTKNIDVVREDMMEEDVSMRRPLTGKPKRKKKKKDALTKACLYLQERGWDGEYSQMVQ